MLAFTLTSFLPAHDVFSHFTHTQAKTDCLLCYVCTVANKMIFWQVYLNAIPMQIKKNHAHWSESVCLFEKYTKNISKWEFPYWKCQAREIQQLLQGFQYGITRLWKFCTSKMMPQKEIALWRESCRDCSKGDQNFKRQTQNCTLTAVSLEGLGSWVGPYQGESLPPLLSEERNSSQTANWMDQQLMALIISVVLAHRSN